jgi:biotin carboxylase
VIITDAYGTANLIAPNFKSLGFECVHVRSSENIPTHYLATYRSSDFILEIAFSNFAKESETLSNYSILAVIPGAESGVEAAETISHSISVQYRNPAGVAKRCRNKYLMQKTLEENGIKSLPQILTRSLDEILTWRNNNELSIVVLKPMDSSASDNVHICKNIDEIRSAHAAIINSKNNMSIQNVNVLAQEYLHDATSGSSVNVVYNVNAVSFGGDHYVSDILKTRKSIINGSLVHDYMELLCPRNDTEYFEKAEEYALSVLDAIQFKFGMSHIEIMIVNGKPMLIEIAGRLPGGSDPSAYAMCMGYTQISVFVSAIFDTDSFRKLLQAERRSNHRNLFCVFLISHFKSKMIRDKKIEFWIEKILTLHSIMVRDSECISITKDLFTSPGHIYLVDQSRDALETDYMTIRSIEDEYFKSRVSTIK